MNKKLTRGFPIQEGEASRQAHCDLPDGTYERELGREGFYGPVSHMHHKHPPTGWEKWEGPLRPHAFDLNNLNAEAISPWLAAPLLYNRDVRLRFWKLEQNMEYLVRNSDGDELLFVHQGAGEFFCDYGHLTFRDGDYISVPRGTVWRIEPTEACAFLMIENTDGMYSLPEKGMLGYNAIFDPACLDYPKINDQFRAQQDENPWKIYIKREGHISKVTYPFNPLDAIGWHGTNTVLRVNWRDIRPLMSHRYHLPPSVHTTFVGSGLVVCTFVPRPVESDPGALKVPFFHNNDDFDEVLFYHKGNFFSRDHIEAGMMTHHPCGFPHGPHPKALKKSMENPVKEIDEVAVMIDTRRPLKAVDSLWTVENKGYVDSWKGGEQ
ncbi:homogentisate 1,2-dioxygenase [Sansalvadorimonas verongulae]|uniref:homogentisate 1,2-dioxygenase n=1 Tax=Sansalvadorimonas verongulae TaxID=2172824 RepID=UPI0012BCD92D|nr:homogentisate 1,2-dioxygenase [Sansalvadorimonas verongulae]MTI13053.1 homogentisate 1,2-dioxygenase [Sansalvadorimonas verongulae]